MSRKGILAKAISDMIDLKVEIRRLRRQAREEVRLMKKAGVSITDLSALERSIKSSDWLLKNRTKDGIREAIREFGKIDVGRGIMINYKDYVEARTNWRRYNQSVEAWNVRHAKEIKAGTVERRYKKPWSIAVSPDDTQEDVQDWIDNLRINFASASAYYKGLWGTYITNVIKAVRTRTPVGMDWIIEFFKNKLPETVPKTNGDYFELRFYYGEVDRFKAFRDLAEHYGLAQEWHDLMEEHKDEVANFKGYI